MHVTSMLVELGKSAWKRLGGFEVALRRRGTASIQYIKSRHHVSFISSPTVPPNPSRSLQLTELVRVDQVHMLPESSETLDDAWGDVVPWGGFLCAFGFLLVSGHRTLIAAEAAAASRKCRPVFMSRRGGSSPVTDKCL